MKARGSVAFGVLAAVLAAGAFVFFLARQRAAGPAEEPAASDAAESTAHPRHAPGAADARVSSVRSQRQKPVLRLVDDEDEDDARTPAERALEERIEKALDDEDFELAVACAEEAQKCGDAEIRQSMVDTLGWFGEKALPELTPFLADADEDVRESAMNEWTMALSSIEDEGVKIRTVELAMGVLNDEDALEEISNEYIGADEKLAVESLARIIEGGGSKEGVEKAKETYEFVTGDEWTDVAGAERWIAEEYEPPEET